MNTIKVVLGFIELAFALKVLLCGRLGLRMAFARPRSVPLNMDCTVLLTRSVPHRVELKFASDQGSSDAMPVPCVMLGLVSFAFAILYGSWPLGCSLQGC